MDENQELKTFTDKKQNKVTTIKGEVLNILEVGWAVEQRVLESLASILEALPKSAIEDKSDIEDKKGRKKKQDDLILGFNFKDWTEILSSLFKTAPQEITNIVCLILKKESEWVGENLNIKGIMEVLSPFFVERGKILSAMLPPNLRAILKE